MHSWPSKSIVKGNAKYSPSNYLSKPPKGTSVEEWKKTVAEFKMNKLIVMNAVPKASQKKIGSKRD